MDSFIISRSDWQLITKLQVLYADTSYQWMRLVIYSALLLLIPSECIDNHVNIIEWIDKFSPNGTVVSCSSSGAATLSFGKLALKVQVVLSECFKSNHI